MNAERLAWVYLAALCLQERPFGLCTKLYTAACGDRDLAERMQSKINLSRSYDDYCWPLTPAGMLDRAAFCLAKAEELNANTEMVPESVPPHAADLPTL